MLTAVLAGLLMEHGSGYGGAGADATPNPAAPATDRYRSLTEHTPESVRTSTHRLDWRNRPALLRTFPGAPTVALPPPRQLQTPALDAIAERAAVSGELDLAGLGTMLFLSGGITGERPGGGDIRATAAAGALYPNEIYVVAGSVGGLQAGVYHFEPKEFRLARLRAGDWRQHLAGATADARVGAAPATIVITGIPWRTMWKYRARGYRHLHWDGGMIVAHLLAAAAAANLQAETFGTFVDRAVDGVVGADGNSELTIALVSLGIEETPSANPPPVPEPPPALDLVPTVLSPHPVVYPEALQYHSATRLAAPSAVLDVRNAGAVPHRSHGAAMETISLPAAAEARGDRSLDAVVRRRRSTRHFALRDITLRDLAAVLERPTRPLSADFLRQQVTLVETYVIANAVRGLDPGAYHYDPAASTLVPLTRGDMRRTAGFLCLEQPLAYDAGAVLFYLADLEGLGRRLGERGYRLAELEAGVRAGRAYLAAYAIGRGATGLTFYDREVTRAFSPHAHGLAPLLVVAVGIPAGRS